MLNEKLEELNKHIDRIALSQRLHLESEHCKRIKCLKTLRIFISPEKEFIKIRAFILGKYGTIENATIWEFVKRVMVTVNTNVPNGREMEGEDDEGEGESVERRGSEIVERESESVERESESVERDTSARDNETNKISNKTDQTNRETNKISNRETNKISNRETNKITHQTNKTHNDIEIHEWTQEDNALAFAVKRKGSQKTLQLLIKFLNQRSLFKLSKELKELLNVHSDTKQNIMKQIYKYITENKLYEYPTVTVNCDEKLKQIFKIENFNFNDVESIIFPYLEPIGYCIIDINKNKEEIWDIQIECDDLNEMPSLYSKNVKDLEMKIESIKMFSNSLEDRINILEEFIEDPVYFVNRKIALETEGLGAQTAFYDDINVQGAVYDLIRKFGEVGRESESVYEREREGECVYEREREMRENDREREREGENDRERENDEQRNERRENERNDEQMDEQ